LFEDIVADGLSDSKQGQCLNILASVKKEEGLEALLPSAQQGVNLIGIFKRQVLFFLYARLCVSLSRF
jgi:hypothetical protein